MIDNDDLVLTMIGDTKHLQTVLVEDLSGTSPSPPVYTCLASSTTFQEVSFAIDPPPYWNLELSRRGLSSSMGSSLRPRSCPCCQFLPDDFLFLLPTADEEEDENDASEEQAHDPTNETTTGEVNLKDARTNRIDAKIQINPGKLVEDVVQPQPLRPRQAWEEIRTSCRQLVDTHGHPHLERTDDDDSEDHPPDTSNDNDDDEEYPVKSLYRTTGGSESSNPSDTSSSCCTTVSSLTCAVAPSDWEACLKHASQNTHRMAALGVHPWFIDELLNDDNQEDLQTGWLNRLEQMLQQHPNCMVGEIGLCKQARFLRTYAGGKAKALQLQRNVFVQQLHLAAQLQRSVSVHCVNQHGVLLEVLQSFEKEEEKTMFPPAIALHSFTGTAHHVHQLLQWEDRLHCRPVSSSQAPLLYFGFSHMVNCAMVTSDKARRQGRDAVRSIPLDRLLVESDVSCTADVVGGTSGAVAYVAWALSKPLHVVADVVARNGLRFLLQQQEQEQEQRLQDSQTQPTPATALFE